MQDPIYNFVVVPWKRTEPVFNRWIPYTIFSALEANFVARRIPAEVLRLIDGTVVYRVEIKYLNKLKFDNQGPYLDLLSFGVKRFTDVDPSVAILPVRSREDWMPV